MRTVLRESTFAAHRRLYRSPYPSLPTANAARRHDPMTRIRVFREGDVPAAVELFTRARPENGWAAADCERYFHEVLFNNPWRDLAVPSWVAEADGRIVGFYVVLPRRMALNGRTLRAAVGCQIVVEPR